MAKIYKPGDGDTGCRFRELVEATDHNTLKKLNYLYQRQMLSPPDYMFFLDTKIYGVRKGAGVAYP